MMLVKWEGEDLDDKKMEDQMNEKDPQIEGARL